MDGAGGGGGDSEGTEAATAALKRKIAALNLAVISGAREAERTEALLAAQTSIARALAGEVAELTARLAGESGGGKRKLADMEALAERRGARIGVLEAQVRQLLAKCKELSAAKSEALTLARASAGGGAASAARAGDSSAISLVEGAAGESTSVADPQSPEVGQRSEKGGVVMDSTLPSPMRQFTVQG